MVKYIFKNYDKLLESLQENLSTLFFKEKIEDKKNLSLKPEDLIDIEIKKQERNLKEKDDINIKSQIRKKILYLKLKQKALKYLNMYIKRAQDILADEVEESAYEALDYLNRAPRNLSKEKLKEIHLYKALIYELLEDFDEATKEYKRAIKLDNTTNSLNEYKEFVERSREVLSWYNEQKDDLRYSSLNIHNIVKIEDMPKVAKRLESIAKYYARSPKSRELGKRYFKEVIKMYKKLNDYNPKKFNCDYINSLIEGVEIFMMSPTLLKEANSILLKSRDCVEHRLYLIEKIKELKSRNFIKKTTLFE